MACLDFEGQRRNRHIAFRCPHLCEHIDTVIQAGSAVGIFTCRKADILERSILQLLL